MTDLMVLFGAVVLALVTCALVVVLTLRGRHRAAATPADDGELAAKVAELEEQVFRCVCELSDVVDELALALEYVAHEARIESPTAEDSEAYDDTLANAWRGVIASSASARRAQADREAPIVWRWVFPRRHDVACDD